MEPVPRWIDKFEEHVTLAMTVAILAQDSDGHGHVDEDDDASAHEAGAANEDDPESENAADEGDQGANADDSGTNYDDSDASDQAADNYVMLVVPQSQRVTATGKYKCTEFAETISPWGHVTAPVRTSMHRGSAMVMEYNLLS